MTELSEKVGMCLKVLLKSSKNYSKFDSKYKKHNKSYFIIDDKKEVINFIDQSNNLNNKHKSIATYDFKTLYTSIPHNLLKEKLKCFVEYIFKRKGKKFISPTNKNAYFTNKSNNVGFSIEQLIECVNYVIDNSYIIFNKKIYQQVVGIPMGTNCAPHLANIFLHMYEMNFINSLNDDGKYKVASLLNNTFRYQDDCLILNDCKQFNRYLDTIYPDVMVLEKTNVTEVECNYLDLCIKLGDDKKFNYKSYDKRDDYNFDVIRYPNLSGNIPFSPAYGVFLSQCKRFLEINNCLDNFIADIRELQSRLVKQGFSKLKLKDRFYTFANNNFHTWSKFGYDIREKGTVDKMFK